MKNSTHEIGIMLMWALLLTLSSCGPSEEQLRHERQQAEQQRIEQEQAEQQRIEEEQAEQRRIEQEQAEQRQKIAYMSAINSVLQLDANTSNISDYTSRAAAMRNIEITQCPQDFAVAYLDHVHAWEDRAKIKSAQNELKEYGGLAAAAGLIATLTDSDSTPFSDYVEAENKLQALANEKIDEIHRTWQLVERTAVSYGATLPH
ncbi:hypothetical protein [Spirosoma endbachense]|uniref:hypothetical protein n=1 Tax=Spirosoma endbachense TaxID=2666025 RepID=UPI0018E09E4B|nr:hypothetical protein [Spirosoma endbachense]